MNKKGTSLNREKGKTAYLYDTAVENIFIEEYLPDIPGDYVKVYLYGLMGASWNPHLAADDIAKALHLSADDVEKAFLYLEDLGLLARDRDGIVFRSLKEQLYGHRGSAEDMASGRDAYGNTVEQNAAAAAAGTSGADGGFHEKQGADDTNVYPRLLDNAAIAEMASNIQDLTGKFLTARDNELIISWLQDYRVEPDLITKAYEYSYDRGGKNEKYVSKVIAGWAKEGLKTRQDAEAYLQERDERYHLHKRVMQALGFHRSVTEEEARLIGSWVDELGCSMAEILDACGKTAGIGNPNIKYVDAVIRGRKKDANKGAERSVVMEYYAALREEAEQRAAAAKQEVYARVPRIEEIDRTIVEKSQEMTAQLLAGDVRKGAAIDAIRAQLDNLEDEKVRLLTEHSIPVDYTEKRYRCNICQDTGVLETGGLCECYVERAKEAAKWAKAQ